MVTLFFWLVEAAGVAHKRTSLSVRDIRASLHLIAPATRFHT